MARLAHRGPDGRAVRLHPGVALGHQHFRTTPEEVGECQPLADASGRCEIAFDGRLDNRAEVLAGLNLSGSEANRLSDAALVLQAYERWGEQCFARLLGPFAAVVYDIGRQTAVCARDATGGRELFYYQDAKLFLAASEEDALLAHPAVPADLDEATCAQFFALDAPSDGRTFFGDIRELLPAHVLVVDAQETRSRCYWEPNPDPPPLRSDGEYAERLLDLLTESVRCRLRTVGTPAVQMSGGMDSTPVAALAARELAARGVSAPLRTISYVFDELASCDERQYINSMTEQYGTEAIHLPGDDAWPLSGWPDWPFNPNAPEITPFFRLQERVWDAARERGTRVVLTGLYGDDLYTGREQWLADLLREHRYAEAWQDLYFHLRREPLAEILRSRTVAYLGGQALDRIPGARRLRPVRAPAAAWLTHGAAGALPGAGPCPPGQALSGRSTKLRTLFGSDNGRWDSRAEHHASQAGVDLRHPYRDRRLLEFGLTLPARLCYRRGYYKPVMRAAMTGILPETVRMRPLATSHLPLFKRGLFEKEAGVIRELLGNPAAACRRFVAGDWLEDHLPKNASPATDGPEQVVLWRCISYELWLSGLGRT